MKRSLYFLVLVAFLSSCSTTKKTATISESVPAPVVPAPVAPAPVPPADITFTQFENFKSFASLQMPMGGKGFGNEINYNIKTDAGENVPSSRYKGGHLIINSDFSSMYGITIDGDNSDINTALIAFQKSSFLRSWLKKEEIIEQYSDVVIAGKTCKRFLVTYGIHREDYSAEFYKFGYIIPHHNTTAFLFMDSGGISKPNSFEKDIEVLDSVFTYMIETVEFRENN
jgi:hypothetical protein